MHEDAAVSSPVEPELLGEPVETHPPTPEERVKKCSEAIGAALAAYGCTVRPVVKIDHVGDGGGKLLIDSETFRVVPR